MEKLNEKIELIPEINDRIFLEIPHQKPVQVYKLSDFELSEAIENGDWGHYQGWVINTAPPVVATMPIEDHYKHGETIYSLNYRERILLDEKIHCIEDIYLEDFFVWTRELYEDDDLKLEFIGHDLHALKIFDSLKEVEEFIESYKGHKAFEAIQKLKEFCFNVNE